MHFSTSERSVCVFWISGIPQLIEYFQHADEYILHLRATSKDRSGKVRSKWRSSTWSAGLAAQPCDVSVARKSKQANQKHRRLFVIIPFAVPGVRCFEELMKCVWLGNRCPRGLHEASWSWLVRRDHRCWVRRPGVFCRFTPRGTYENPYPVRAAQQHCLKLCPADSACGHWGSKYTVPTLSGSRKVSCQTIPLALTCLPVFSESLRYASGRCRQRSNHAPTVYFLSATLK